MAHYILRPKSSEPPRSDDLVLVHAELTFTTTGTTVTHTIETENVIWCAVTPHGTTVAANDNCGWSVSSTTLTVTRPSSGTSGLIVTVVYAGNPIAAEA